jgi:hypothetical protein
MSDEMADETAGETAGGSEPIRMSVAGPAPFVLPAEPQEVMAEIEAARASDDPAAALRDVVAGHPASLFAWAALGDAEPETVHRYAAYRIGYHRGLDALRGNGWRGTGDVRWSEPSNQGFLRALLGLHLMSRAIGDAAEADRTIQFLYQLDRGGPPQAEIDAMIRR